MAILVAPPYRPGSYGGPNERTRVTFPHTVSRRFSAESGAPRRGIPGNGRHPGGPDRRLRPPTGGTNAKGIALLIHHLSGWRWGPFVSIDCGASEQILERQLFDVLKAGADWDRGSEPRPQLMQDGTIFLYEVGKLSLAMQARVADALGSGAPGMTRRRLRKRVMASTSLPLLDRVEAGTFDDRLYYRLNAIHFAPAG